VNERLGATFPEFPRWQVWHGRPAPIGCLLIGVQIVQVLIAFEQGVLQEIGVRQKVPARRQAKFQGLSAAFTYKFLDPSGIVSRFRGGIKLFYF
jgi:hypothetical protein